MDFFESQDRARRKTGQLILLFGLATLSLVAITNLFLFAVSGAYSSAENLNQSLDTQSWQSHALLSLAVVAVIGVASLYKIARLSSGGGETVAQSLGGRLVQADTIDRDERRLLNVVEEMAIAAGVPVPPVYILDDDALNAFAAGFDTDDAVIGITRGCVRFLNRDEMQGVIAHEFSHVLHGDMRINIRLIGVLYGILVIGNIGYFLMRASSFRSRSSERDGLPIILVGLGLIVIGSVGTFFGKVIKASVSRQREFLADASAVQYTRNPEGIGNALRKIGGFRFGSRIQSPNASEASHLFIGEALKMSSLMSTHPPLEKRIAAVMPSWDGSFLDCEVQYREQTRTDHFGASAQLAGAASVAAAVDYVTTESVLESVGEIQQGHIDYAQQLLDSLRADVLPFLRHPEGARAAIYCLLVAQEPAIQAKQLSALEQSEDYGAIEQLQNLLVPIRKLGIEYRIPIIDVCLPVLRTQFDDQDKVFRQNVLQLMQADDQIDMFEWCLHRLLNRHLSARKARGRRSQDLQSLEPQCITVIAALARAGNDSAEQVDQAFAAAMSGFIDPSIVKDSVPEPALQALDSALSDLCHMAPLDKPLFIKACARSVLADGEVKAAEYELLRAIADSLDVPMPPRLAEQSLLPKV